MKNFLFIIFVFLCISAYSQETSFNKEDIAGRWVEDKNMLDSLDYPYTYIFRENMVFHLGEAHEGVILFNIAGKYTVKGDLIDVVYFDFVQGSAQSRKARHIQFKIQSIENDKMILRAKDYDYEYDIILKKQKY